MKTAGMFIFISLFSSCMHMQSGRYVRSEGRSLKQMAKELKIPEWQIMALNPSNRLAGIFAGPPGRGPEWVFVPLKRGLIRQQHSYAWAHSYLRSGKLAWPVPSSKRISSGFGMRRGRPHHGIDIPAPSGTKIVAADSGVVIYSGRGLGGYGNTTVISHEQGFFTVYAHARRNYTRRGQRVRKGEPIAEIGNTGRSRGNHLHFEVRYDSKPIDPKGFLAAH